MKPYRPVLSVGEIRGFPPISRSAISCERLPDGWGGAGANRSARRRLEPGRARQWPRGVSLLFELKGSDPFIL